MNQNDFYKTTRERLAKYKVFSNAALDFTAQVAKKQLQFQTYKAFFEAADIPLEPVLFVNSRGKGVPVVDVASRDAEQGMFVMFLPMGNSLDTNQLYQIAAMAHAFPSYRIVAFGNPSGAPFAYKEQNFSFVDWWRVAFTKNRRAIVSAELDYLYSQGVKQAHFIGYSYGALKALTGAQYAGDGLVKALILLDPVAHSRGAKQLLEDFTATSRPLGNYVNRTRLETYFAARDHAAKTVNFNQGLRRPVNIAIGLMLSRIDFISTLSTVLKNQSQLTAFIAWGSKSELGNDAHMKANLYNFEHKTYKGRVRSLRLDGDVHAFANDVHESVAIVHTALL